MNRKTTRTLLGGFLVALVLSAAFAASASAAPVWKFGGTTLEGSETVMGGAYESSMTIPGLTTKCENFLYKLTIKNEGGTGKGELTEMPLYTCSTDSPEVCQVKSIGAESLPWPAHLTTITNNYIVIEKAKVGITYSGKECVLKGIFVQVTGTAGGLISNETETATFNPSSFSATKTQLEALGNPIEWLGVFPTEAFESRREQALTVS